MRSILITIVSIVIMPGFLRRFTSDAGLIASGITYSTIVFLFATINMAGLAFEKMFQAVGRMKVTMAALIFGCVCNILLDPILIFGLGPVPAMGIAGAALATGIGQQPEPVCLPLFYYRHRRERTVRTYVVVASRPRTRRRTYGTYVRRRRPSDLLLPTSVVPSRPVRPSSVTFRYRYVPVTVRTVVGYRTVTGTYVTCRVRLGRSSVRPTYLT